MIRKLLLLGVAVGTANALGAGFVPLRLPHLLTYDAAIIKEMQGCVRQHYLNNYTLDCAI